MKKLLVIAVFAGGLIAIVSCKKDRTCSCDVTTTGFVTTSVTVDTVFTDVSKSEAKDKCDDLDQNVSAFGQTIVSECELK